MQVIARGGANMSISGQILDVLRGRARGPHLWASSSELASALPVSVSSIKRHLDALVRSGRLVRGGQARATRYRLATGADQPFAARYATYATYATYGRSIPGHASSSGASSVLAEPEPTPAFPMSSQAEKVLERLRRPVGVRDIVGYDRSFVDGYEPNRSFLLPPAIAESLAQRGRIPGQQPAGTYARKVLEPLLIDLSWSSSRLEGNRYSLLATEELFRSGLAAGAGGGDLDAVMLLNHKSAIEFMVDAVPEFGLTSAVVQNMHAVLMQDLLADADGLGKIRERVVNIRGTTYIPLQSPRELKDTFERILDKTRLIKNPVEAAFFVWVNLAYLQPFEDGNKRCSRLAANIPLMLYNNAPLSFLDVESHDYAYAMMSVYEHRDVSLAADLFVWAYERSIAKYAVLLDVTGVPDPVRLRFRDRLTEVIGAIVREGSRATAAIADAGLSESDIKIFGPMLAQELKILDLHNCARYRLALGQVRRWIEAGRPC